MRVPKPRNVLFAIVVLALQSSPRAWLIAQDQEDAARPDAARRGRPGASPRTWPRCSAIR